MLVDKHKFLKLPVVLGMQQSWLHIPPVSSSLGQTYHQIVQRVHGLTCWMCVRTRLGRIEPLLQFARLEDVISCALREQALFPKTFDQPSKGPSVDGTCSSSFAMNTLEHLSLTSDRCCASTSCARGRG